VGGYPVLMVRDDTGAWDASMEGGGALRGGWGWVEAKQKPSHNGNQID